MSLDKEQMTALYRNLVRADHFNRMMYRRMMQGKLIGFYHPAEGAIAPGVGACTFLNQDDNLSPHHRGHGIAHMLSKGIDIKYYLAEHTGKDTGCCGGRSAFHFSFPEHKVYMMSGFVGYNFAPSVGWGLAAKRRAQRQVVMNCSGDGSYGQGRAHEALLMASNWNLPIIFLCENNGLSIFSTATEMHPVEDISSMARAYDMPAVICDGQDVFAVAEAALSAIERARSGGGPTFVEAKTLRFSEHDIGTPDLVGWEERSEQERSAMQEREPVRLATERILGENILNQAGVDRLQEEAEAEVAAVEEFADNSEIARPPEAELLADVFAPSGGAWMRTVTLIDAIGEACREEMRRDDAVFMVGQDIRGAIFPHTKGLVDEFGPDRILDTPIAESGMYGAAFGAAQEGLRPIVDFMFGGFSYVTFSECSVTTGQYYFLHGSQQPLPIVITAGVGVGQRLANDHAMSIHGTFAHHPGIKVAMPSTPHDAKGMFKAAIRDDNPVVIPWHMGLMMDKGEIPEDDYVVPLGVADVRREGEDCTVLANSVQLRNALKVAESLEGEISVEVIDPRSFVPFDMQTLLTSLEKTGRLVVVDEDWESGGFAATVSARVMEQGFDLLDAPVTRVTLPNMPVPGGYMEEYVAPNPEKIEAAVRAVCD